MIQDTRIDELLDEALHTGRLTPALKKALHEAGETSPEESFRLHELAASALKQASIQNQVRLAHEQYWETRQKMHVPATVIPLKPKRYRRLLTIAAACLLITGGWFVFEMAATSNSSMYKKLYEPYYINTPRADQSLQETDIVTKFRNKDYAAVIDAYASRESHDRREAFLAGMAALEIGQPHQAVAFFQQVLAANQQTKEKIYQDEAEYYLALACLLDQQPAEALSIFDKINHDPNHSYHGKLSKLDAWKIGWLKNK